MRTTALILSALLFGVLPERGVAQANESSAAHLRNDCRLAAQVLATGHPAPRRAWALQRIDLCDRSGPAVLIQMWSRVPPTRAALEELEVPSTRLRDRRVYVALSEIAQNASEPSLKRIIALDVLAWYAAPNRGMPLDELLDPRPDSVRSIRLTAVDYSPHTVGAEPLPETITDDVTGLLRNIANGEPTSAVGVAASRLLRFVLVRN